jgi:hypothetical protein
MGPGPIEFTGRPGVQPPFPRGMKWDASINNISGDIVAFLDHLRASGRLVERTWTTARLSSLQTTVSGVARCARQTKTSGPHSRGAGRIGVYNYIHGIPPVSVAGQVGPHQVSAQ